MKLNVDIFAYCDYRSFLRDAFESLQSQLPGFTHRSFASRAGFASSGSLKLVMDGERHLSEDSALKVVQALRLDKKQQSYFLLMMDFAKSKSMVTKAELLTRMDKFRAKHAPELLHDGDFEYLSTWYHCVIREMVGLPDFKEDPKWIAQQLQFALKPDLIRQSLEYLEASGFLRRENEFLVKTAKTVATGSMQDQSRLLTTARAFHLKMMEKAMQAVEKLPREQRSISNTTFSMSEQSYQKALQRIEQLRMEILELAASDSQADQVHQLSICLFPMTQKDSQ